MTDIVDQRTRSRMMSGIRGKNTKPEVLIRSLLHSRGYRFRKHYDRLPGKPDIALPKYRALILVNGCFWHGHDCHLFKWPATNHDFWKQKFSVNIARDRKLFEIYRQAGWRVLTIWECSLKGKRRLSETTIVDQMTAWLNSAASEGDIQGNGPTNF